MAVDSRIPATVMAPAVTPMPIPVTAPVEKKAQNYKGFVAGVFSGIAKLTGELQFLLSRPPLSRLLRAGFHFQIGSRELVSSSWSLLLNFG